MNDKYRVIQRIKKVIALTQSAYPYEAVAAARKAHEMIREYDIDVREIFLSSDERAVLGVAP